jgi:hypothetical protein
MAAGAEGARSSCAGAALGAVSAFFFAGTIIIAKLLGDEGAGARGAAPAAFSIYEIGVLPKLPSCAVLAVAAVLQGARARSRWRRALGVLCAGAVAFGAPAGDVLPGPRARPRRGERVDAVRAAGRRHRGRSGVAEVPGALALGGALVIGGAAVIALARSGAAGRSRLLVGMKLPIALASPHGQTQTRPHRPRRQSVTARAAARKSERSSVASSPGRSTSTRSRSGSRARPRTRRLRIGQLSDIRGAQHPDGRIIGAVNALNERRPDIVVLTGDYVTRRATARARPELLGRLDGDVYAVLGNHDHWTDAHTIKRDLQRCAFHVLQNQHTTVRVKGAVHLLGIDDGVTRRADIAAWKGAPPPARASCSRMRHHRRPAAARRGLACLSGHTHGGQIYVGAVTELRVLERGPALRCAACTT